MGLNNRSNNTYEEEIFSSLDRLRNDHKELKYISYFLDLSKSHFDLKNIKKSTPKIVVLGTNIPEEIIYALNEVPYYIIGGSLGSFSWADSYVPRDTDSVSKSILGFLKNEEITSFKDSLIIVPITCDSMRKIAYMLEEDYNIVTVDFPSDKESKYANEKWLKEMTKLKVRLEKFTKKKMSKKQLIKSIQLTSMSRKTMRSFIQISKANNHLISGSMVQFILNTYYFEENIEIWTNELSLLIHEIKSLSKKHEKLINSRPNILIMGSPIYFPNLKIPFLLEDIDLNLGSCINGIIQKAMIEYDFDIYKLSKGNLFEKIMIENYKRDCSPAYVNNESLLELCLNIENDNQFDGVVYHIIKGQIEYDFELEMYEEIFSKMDIPVFRLETDYNYQDIEQIRIRLEAFMEMLEHKRYQSGRVVS